MTKVGLALLIATSIGWLAGCEDKGPMEEAGAKADRAIERAGDKVEDATESDGPLERAGEEVDDAVEKAGDKVERATD